MPSSPIRRVASVASILFICTVATAQPSAIDALNKAFDALRAKHYDAAIDAFRTAVRAAPSRADIHMNLAYAYLKVGDMSAARDEFAAAIRLNPSDQQAALEYAYLANDTGQKVQARRTFNRLRKAGNTAAEQAFQNIDRPLAQGIARWTEAVTLTPANFSAHQELARLAEERDDFPTAAEHYRKAWELRPTEASLLVDLGRMYKELGNADDALAAFLAASRRGTPRVSEAARELLPARYPYVYEFQKALALDPKNIELRHELGYLHMEMGKPAEAEKEFRRVLEFAPDDALAAAQVGFLLMDRDDVAAAMPLLERAVKSNDRAVADRVREALRVPQHPRKRGVLQANAPRPTVPVNAEDPKSLGVKSLQAGYLNDALKYLKLAHELDPSDYAVVLKLGWTNNMLHDDKQAMEWFDLARRSADPQIATEANTAYKNLRPSVALFRTTAWITPFYSSRWKDVFAYSQLKTDLNLGRLGFRPYLSTRIIGDTRNTTGNDPAFAQPQYLSESSVILALGVATSSYKGLTAWAEAGEAIRYRNRKDVGFMTPDYRGGVSYAHGFGHTLGREGAGVFFETNEDGVYLSRFQHDVLGYVQTRLGYTLPSLGALQLQLYWNSNVTIDLKRQYWANFYEYGPGLKFRFSTMPQGLSFTVNAVQGTYLVNEGNPRGPRFYDLRAGFWYAFTH